MIEKNGPGPAGRIGIPYNFGADRIGCGLDRGVWRGELGAEPQSQEKSGWAASFEMRVMKMERESFLIFILFIF